MGIKDLSPPLPQLPPTAGIQQLGLYSQMKAAWWGARLAQRGYLLGRWKDLPKAVCYPAWAHGSLIQCIYHAFLGILQAFVFSLLIPSSLCPISVLAFYTAKLALVGSGPAGGVAWQT